jgi:hypothetical protein
MPPTRISPASEMANLRALGAEINGVRRGIGRIERVGL